MTDPEMADRTYIEPITWEVVARIIERERPDALLPTVGGQTALNCAMALHHQGVLGQFKVEMIGARPHAVGYRLDELRNDITRETPACFEPTIAYVLPKSPRWPFEKFPTPDT